MNGQSTDVLIVPDRDKSVTELVHNKDDQRCPDIDEDISISCLATIDDFASIDDFDYLAEVYDNTVQYNTTCTSTDVLMLSQASDCYSTVDDDFEYLAQVATDTMSYDEVSEDNETEDYIVYEDDFNWN